MENAIAQIEEAARKDKDETRKPKPEVIAMIDMDNLLEFRPVPVCFN
jgi:hypothetical protein